MAGGKAILHSALGAAGLEASCVAWCSRGCPRLCVRADAQANPIISQAAAARKCRAARSCIARVWPCEPCAPCACADLGLGGLSALR